MLRSRSNEKHKKQLWPPEKISHANINKKNQLKKKKYFFCNCIFVFCFLLKILYECTGNFTSFFIFILILLFVPFPPFLLLMYQKKQEKKVPKMHIMCNFANNHKRVIINDSNNIHKKSIQIQVNYAYAVYICSILCFYPLNIFTEKNKYISWHQLQ